MGVRFNPPPGWPHPPEGWRPAPNWAPDPSWPLPPDNWEFWIRDEFPGPFAGAPAAAPGGLAVQTVTETAPSGRDQGPVSTTLSIPVQGGSGDQTPPPGPAGRPRWLLPALAAGLAGALVLAFVLTRGGDEPVPGTGPAPTTRATPSRAATSAAPSPAPVTADPGALLDGTAQAALDALPVTGDAPSIPYTRAAFGTGWSDADGNGCDTGNDVLRRDLTAVTLRPGSRCVVAGGTLLDPYVARRAAYPSISGKVAVDFVVPLADAWASGASAWTAQQRAAFVNDPANLQAVQTATTAKKRNRGAGEWLPSSVKYRCPYVARQIGLKTAYSLGVSPAEKAAMQGVLAACPQQRIPAGIVVPASAGGAPSADATGSGTQPSGTAGVSPSAAGGSATGPSVPAGLPFGAPRQTASNAPDADAADPDAETN